MTRPAIARGTLFAQAIVVLAAVLLFRPSRAEDAADHWSFRRLASPVAPHVAPVEDLQAPVDAFIAEKLAKVNLRLARAADRVTLARRLSLDLVGLPPSAEQLDALRFDDGPDAVERFVDRLLASPQHGPRWARYWLDVAGYADSNGYFSADSDRPLAWQYRDYVVSVHNADRPFDEFVREQLAGDEISGYDPAKTIQPGWADALIATHYLRNAPDGTGESDGNPDEVRVDRYTVLEGTLQIVGTSLLGLTVQCCRCHDHKFEPLSQRDYYQLQAFLYPAYHVENWVKPNERVVQLGDRKIAWLSDLSPNPPEVALLVRGDPKQRGDLVSPAVPAVLADPASPLRIEPPAARRTTGRRLALARWLTQPGSRAEGLLARVAANRVWQHHFDTGLVSTPENLGVTGSTPSHEALLDYLAARFVAHGWSMKRLHREIVLSATYAQASTASAEALRVDPSNQWISRFPLHRVDAEALRDSLLSVSGEIDLTLGGPFVPTARSGVGEVAVDPKHAGARRRGLYLQQRRTQTESFLSVFDAPSIVASCPRRPTTTTPLQSLTQLNSRFARERAEAIAAWIVTEHPAAAQGGPEPKFDAMFLALFWRVLAREPLPEERAASAEFMKAQLAEYGTDRDAVRRAWTDFCQMILASNAFVYVE